MLLHRKPPSQTWRAILEGLVRTVVAADCFPVPTIRFQVLSVFLVLALDRRRIRHSGATADPPAEWTAQKHREAFLWGAEPGYLLLDHDRSFGKDFVNQIRATGFR